jgi:nucleoside-diphosphate-sugar epimerase
MPLRVLFIGGTGNISLPCVAAAVAAGHQVTVFNRGSTAVRLPTGVASIVGDMNDAEAYRELGKAGFDVVCQFIVFTPEQNGEGYPDVFGRRSVHIHILGLGLRKAAAPLCHLGKDAHVEPLLGL